MFTFAAFQNHFPLLRGRPFDFWGGYSFRKKYLVDWFRGKKILTMKYLLREKNSYIEKKAWLIILGKKLTLSCMSGEKVISPEVWRKKNSSPNQITHSPSQKSNGRPLTIVFVSKTILYHFGQTFSCNFGLASCLHRLRDRNCTKRSIVLISQLVYSFIYFYNWFTYKCSRTF